MEFYSFLYSICSGFNGSSVSDFALSRTAADILLGGGIGMAAEKSDDDIKDLLRATFISAEKGYNTSIDNLLATKQQLQFQILDLSQYEISQKYEDVLNRLNTINKELTVGSSVLIALITNKKLYIANLGVCRALLVKNDVSNEILRVIQVTVDHNLHNEDEVLRLCGLGLDVGSLHNKISCTRCIGNHMGKGGYKDSEVLSQSFAEPISSCPDVVGPITIDESARFLLLLSGGLCHVLCQLFSEDLNIVNKELVSIVVQQFSKQSTLVGVAQSTINTISQLHHDLYMKQIVSSNECKFHSRDDMSLLIRNFSFDMPHSIENSKLSPMSSTMTNATMTNTSYSSTNTSVNYSSLISDRRTKPYVNFKEYFDNVEIARSQGKLPKNIDFDDAPLA